MRCKIDPVNAYVGYSTRRRRKKRGHSKRLCDENRKLGRNVYRRGARSLSASLVVNVVAPTEKKVGAGCKVLSKSGTPFCVVGPLDCAAPHRCTGLRCCIPVRAACNLAMIQTP
jgi:hypothetical protein